MSEWSRVRSATDEDLERFFPDGFVFGVPVRPPVDESQPGAEQPERPLDEEQP